MTKKELFLQLARPNKDGVSRWVLVSEFEGEYKDLRLGNGGSWFRPSSSIAKEYVVESEDPDTIEAKKEWDRAKKAIESAINNHQSTEYIQKCINTANTKYNDFIIKLKIALRRKGVLV
jgi:hypothetical protein